MTKNMFLYAERSFVVPVYSTWGLFRYLISIWNRPLFCTSSRARVGPTITFRYCLRSDALFQAKLRVYSLRNGPNCI